MKTSRFNHKNAIVTGGGSGIGRGLVQRLAERGCNVAIVDINKEAAENVATEVSEKYSIRAEAYHVDNTELIEVKEFAKAYRKDFKEVEVLCLNAGIAHGGNFQDTSIETWEKVININIWGAIYMLNQFSGDLVAQKSGAILITASMAGLAGMPGMSTYCTSKFAMVGLAESLRAELREHNIVVSALCPGIINTNIVKATDEIQLLEKSKVISFYEKFGESPENTAEDGIKALEKDISVMVTPLNTFFPWLLKRFSPNMFEGISSFLWKRLRDSRQ